MINIVNSSKINSFKALSSRFFNKLVKSRNKEKESFNLGDIFNKIKVYLFAPRFRFNRIQFNFVAIFFIFLGLTFGTYLTLSHFWRQAFALNDTVTTWTFNSANASQFTYDNNLVTVNNSGAFPGVNKLTNPNFDIDLAGWSEVPSYTLNDQFTTNRSAGAVHGTAAEPTGGNRTVVDTEGKLSISSSQLSFSGGKTSPTAGDPGIGYPPITRAAGKLVTFSFTSGATDKEARFGFSTSQSGVPKQGLNIQGSASINLTDPGSPSLGSYLATTNYQIATVLRSTGAYNFIKGGTYTNWTLLWIDTVSSTSTLYPVIANYNKTFTADNVRIPTATWLPTPLAYSTFTTGGATSTETVGPDSQTTPSLALTGGTVASGTLTTNPTLLTEKVTNGDFDTNTTGWSTLNGAVLTSVAGGQSGNALELKNGVSDDGWAYQSFAVTTGKYYFLDFYVKTGTGSPGGYLDVGSSLAGAQMLGETYLGATSSFVQKRFTFRATASTMYLQFHVSDQVLNHSIFLDSISVKEITLSSLFSTVPTVKSDVIADVNVTVGGGTQSGLVMNLDSTSSPANFVIAYVGNASNVINPNTVYLYKSVGGVYTNVQTTTVTYSAGATLRVIKEGTKYRVYYNNALVGSEQTISDAGIINNTTHGMFSTYSGNTLDNFTLWARGTGAEYTDAPFEELTPTRDTVTKYAGAASAKLVTSGTDANYLQSVNVGDTSSYNLVAYAYTTGAAVTTNDVNLYYDTSVVSTTFTSVGGGWYRLTGTVTGAASSKNYGVRVKASKTVYVDEVKLERIGTYSVYNTTAYENLEVDSWDTFCEGVLSGFTCTEDATHASPSAIKYQLCTDDGSTCQSGSSWKYWNGSTWAAATDTTTTVNTPAQLTNTAMNALSVSSRKLSVRAIFTYDGVTVPFLPNISIGLTTDTTAPTTNASSIVMTRNNGGTSVALNGWTNDTSPYFTWTAGADDGGGSGMKGYCLYLGTDISGNPASDKGLLGTSPVDTTGTTCDFIVSSTSIDFATVGFRGVTWLTTSSSPYYLNIRAVDIAGNVTASSEQFSFRYDNTVPTNLSYISCASGNFSNVVDMNFNWPTSGGTASSDANANVLGWQYQLNTTSGSWLGTDNDPLLNLDYIPNTESSYTLDASRDGGQIVAGNNVVYFRTVDNAGNVSVDATIRTCNLSYGANAPEFGGSDVVTVSPSTSTTNLFALEWPAATASTGQSVAGYYYMINTPPPSTYATLTGNVSTYIPNGTATTVALGDLPNVNKGSNTVYVVAVDDASTPNYSPSNYISGTFTLNSTDPNNVVDLVASDSSIKSQAQWNVTLTWGTPTYQGAGNLTYLVYRSSNGTSFSQVGTTSGLSYVDNVPTSSLFYYKVYAKDGADALSSGTNSVSITPTGKWTTAPTLQSGPSVSNITTRKATITWSTSRAADSKVQYGTKSNVYGVVESSNSTPVTAHSIELSGLNASTAYFYRVKWTDEDGNTGISSEHSFATASAPRVRDISVKNIGLSSAVIQFTASGASKVKIYYGKTTDFGGAQEMVTSSSDTTLTAQLVGLSDGTKYYYKINTFDADGSEYQGTILNFSTLPRPKITGILVQQVINTPQPTLLVTWSSNTGVSSIVTYYPSSNSKNSKDEVNLDLVKGEHKMIIRGLLAKTEYTLIVKGKDIAGNEGVGKVVKVTTASDTRSPMISDLKIESESILVDGEQKGSSQLVISWNTDEPATGQVEFEEGTGTSYTQKTQEDGNLTVNHIVIISNLSDSKVYHLRVLSSDNSGNMSRSIDTVTITAKGRENALDLVIFNLLKAFGL